MGTIGGREGKKVRLDPKLKRAELSARKDFSSFLNGRRSKSKKTGTHGQNLKLLGCRLLLIRREKKKKVPERKKNGSSYARRLSGEGERKWGEQGGVEERWTSSG